VKKVIVMALVMLVLVGFVGSMVRELVLPALAQGLEDSLMREKNNDAEYIQSKYKDTEKYKVSAYDGFDAIAVRINNGEESTRVLSNALQVMNPGTLKAGSWITVPVLK
jgi:hypothetical protein